MEERLGKYIFVKGMMLVLIMCLAPANTFQAYTTHSPIEIATIIICPLLGLWGLSIAIIEEDEIYIVLNGLLMFAYPIAIILGHLINTIL